jgi:hypothetical protein
MRAEVRPFGLLHRKTAGNLKSHPVEVSPSIWPSGRKYAYKCGGPKAGKWWPLGPFLAKCMCFIVEFLPVTKSSWITMETASRRPKWAHLSYKTSIFETDQKACVFALFKSLVFCYAFG